MYDKLLRLMEKQYKQRTIVSCFLVAVIILEIDYLTCNHLEFPAIYVLPVGMAAWRKKYVAYTLSVVMPLCRVGFIYFRAESDSLLLLSLNALIVMLSLLFYTYLIHRIAWQSTQLTDKVKVLEGILPVCASCGRIRNESGNYEKLEKYVAEHTEASFSHGICPECAKRLYPEYYNERNKTID
jgi:hypothetical protein